MSGPTQQLKYRRFESETPRLFAFRDCAKWLTPRMWLNTQFFVMEVAREPFENMNE